MRDDLIRELSAALRAGLPDGLSWDFAACWEETERGTAVDAMGLAATLPGFRAAGLELATKTRHDDGDGHYCVRRVPFIAAPGGLVLFGEEALAMVLDIDTAAAEAIFLGLWLYPGVTSPERVTPEMVADRLDGLQAAA